MNEYAPIESWDDAGEIAAALESTLGVVVRERAPHPQDVAVALSLFIVSTVRFLALPGHYHEALDEFCAFTNERGRRGLNANGEPAERH